MKNIKYLFSFVLLAFVVFNCSKDDDSADYANQIAAPKNVSALVTVTQDNTGLVTLIPLGEGVVSFKINYGDGSELSDDLSPGESTEHIYEEGTYQVVVVATGLNGKTTSVTQPVIVSFQAPQNLVVTIENDAAISKQVNVLATADFATSYEVDFGESGSTPIMSNINETLSFTYQEAGIYTITVTAFSAAVETTSYSEEFEVTAILQPLQAAPAQPARAESDVISIYSGAYNNIAGTDYFPNWGQTTTYAEIDIAGNPVIQYANLNYQGIQYGETIDASAMEFLHVDVWTTDDNQMELYPISIATGEQQVTLDLVGNQWNSYNIPLSDFTDLGLSMADLHQFKFVGSGTVFIDNLYYYRAASGVVTSMIEDFEGTPPTFTTFGNIADTQVVANPDATGINTSSNVAQLTKTAGSEVWAGTFFETAAPIDLVSYGKINVKTWSPTAGAVVKLKLENVDSSIVYEVDANTTVTNQWENLLYDFSGAPAADYVRIVIFFDFGNAGDGSNYYYDDVELVNNSGSITPLEFQDFEGAPPTFTTFGNIADTQVVANPDATGINATANVAQLTKTAGSEVWAGTFFEVPTALDFSNYSKISVKTWSPNTGGVVKLKLENADSSIVHEVDLNSTVANTWEELVYDFSGAPAADYVRVVMFFDFGNIGDDSVYYFDEFALTN